MTHLQVATAGEALIDLIHNADGRLQPCLGGAVYNLTRALARQGVQTLYLNPLSRDRFGRQLAAGLLADGVHLAVPDAVQQVTSLAVVGVDAVGHPDYSFYREGVADRATTAQAMTSACAQSDTLSVVCTGALALSPDDADTYLPWLASQRQAGRTVVVDANLRPSVMPDLALYRAHVLAALQFADVIKASDEDLECLSLPGADATAQARHLLQHSRAHFLALTRGGEGATLLTRSGQTFHARETAAIAVADTVGAGDCFLAGLVAALLEQGLAADWGSSEVPAAQAHALLGNAIASASICVMRQGCVPPLRAEVKDRLALATVEFA
ncbi:MAG: carbohydrate kinase [Burkholderiales bacterium RIFCSPLOWO2_12_FULL_61_40]|nr:MAG: carbohydrate kinase [Burkholderiales bacterium RIFCSPLOWO2_12_FULL_61_40]